MKKIRQRFQCYDCGKEYELTFEISGYPQLQVVCPYCGAQGTWETDSHRTNVHGTYRGDENHNASHQEGYDFPGVVQVTAPRTSGEQ